MRRHLMIFFVCACVLNAPYVNAEPVVGPFVQWITSDSATIVWETEEPAIGTVEFGKNDLSQAVSGTDSTRIHRLELNNLTPDTRYAYRCRWKNDVTETFTFRTAPPAGTTSTRMAVMGGTNANPDIVEQLVRLVSREQPNLVVHTGDLVSASAPFQQWKDNFFDPFQTLIPQTPLYPVIAPSTLESEQFSTYFSSANGDGYWRLIYGNVLLIGLNTARPGDPGSEQYVWLRNTLNQFRQQWTVVVMNEPMFSIKPNDPPRDIRWHWQPLFQEFGVDLVISGGEPYYHCTYPIGYQRGYPQRGVRHVTVGGGNSVIPSIKSDYTRIRHNAPHYMMLEFEDDTLVVRTVDRNSIPFDAFVVMKQASTNPAEFVSFEMMELERDLSNPENWEQNTRGAEPGIAELRPQIQLNTPFNSAVRGEVRWVKPGNWKLSEPGTIQIEPRELLELDFSALNSAELLPVPQLEITLNSDRTQAHVRAPLDGYKNNTIRVSPLRVYPEVELQIPRSNRPLVEDGEISNRIGMPATPFSNFYVDQTGEQPGHDTILHSYHDDSHLFISAKIFTPPVFPVENASFANGPDPEVLRDNEHARLLISDGENVFEFLVCSNGERLDSRNGDLSWTSGWLSRVERGQQSDWELEMAIPLDVFGGSDIPLQMELVRYDRFSMQSYVMRPSYEDSVTDPTYFATVSFLE